LFNPRPGVEGEEQNVRLFHGEANLFLDVIGELVGVDDADAARVVELDVSVADRQDERDPVAGDPLEVVDDREALAGDPVQKARFADVGPADDDDAGETGHGSNESTTDPTQAAGTRWAETIETAQCSMSSPSRIAIESFREPVVFAKRTSLRVYGD
jgi:hypothetical protein